MVVVTRFEVINISMELLSSGTKVFTSVMSRIKTKF